MDKQQSEHDMQAGQPNSLMLDTNTNTKGEGASAPSPKCKLENLRLSEHGWNVYRVKPDGSGYGCEFQPDDSEGYECEWPGCGETFADWQEAKAHLKEASDGSR